MYFDHHWMFLGHPLITLKTDKRKKKIKNLFCLLFTNSVSARGNHLGATPRSPFKKELAICCMEKVNCVLVILGSTLAFEPMLPLSQAVPGQ